MLTFDPWSLDHETIKTLFFFLFSGAPIRGVLSSKVENIGVRQRDGDLVFRPSSPRWQDRRTLQWQYVPGQVRQ